MENKKYWTSLEDLNDDAAYLAEQFQANAKDVSIEELVTENFSSNRRDFLKMLGFTVSAATLVACTKTPVKYALPYVKAPTDLTPSIPNYYASSFYDGMDYNALLVKVKDGRPIKLEGNHESPITKGGVLARTHASILGLYDGTRLKEPMFKGNITSWEKIDAEITAKLGELSGNGKEIVILSRTVISPSTLLAIKDFGAKFGSVRHVMLDALSQSGTIEAHEVCFGKAAVPAYFFDRAETIVSLNADFLGTWGNTTRYIRQYADNRKLQDGKKTMSRHYQFETNLSITGANADYRVPIRPSQEGLVALNLYNLVANKLGSATVPAPKLELAGNALAAAANDLVANKGKSLVVAGTNNADVQQVVAAINSLLGNYGTTLDLDAACLLHQGRDKEFEQLLQDMAAGKVGAVLVWDTNPVYSYPVPKAVESAFQRVPLKISFADREDETAALCDYILPDHHFLESWNDLQPYEGTYALVQPTINPLYNTRQFQTSLLKWSGDTQDYYSYLRQHWATTFFPLQDEFATPEDHWQYALERGFFNSTSTVKPAKGKLVSTKSYNSNTVSDVTPAAAAIATTKGTEGANFELLLYPKIAIGDGSLANLPWLQELPDPISKVTWDNYVNISRQDAEQFKLVNGDFLTVEVPGKPIIKLPAYILPGQARGTISIAVGYGRTRAGKCADGVGQNVYPFASLVKGNIHYAANEVKVSKAGGHEELAITQSHQTIMGRPIVKETTLAEYQQDPHAGNHERAHLVSLWNVHPKEGIYWAMAIDMNACTGCGSCVISCQAENNIPVVGKDEVRRKREMHWLRIDRYFASSKTNIEQGADNPEVVFQPMLCQHCDNAPCETVCPVLAIAHSSEGLNQQVYNRCVGTKYCANNCPYHVRRFNWFDYANQDGTLKLSDGQFPYNPAGDDTGRLVLNPDVTVRVRGVMEKCTFCVQRLQAAKLEAKKEGRRVRDAEVQTACASSCPANAIVFGDLNDPDSHISKLYHTERAYHVLEELKTLPKISYLTKVRNKNVAEFPTEKA